MNFFCFSSNKQTKKKKIETYKYVLENFVRVVCASWSADILLNKMIKIFFADGLKWETEKHIW